ncbi:hypothetical protein PBI_SCTP2_472 [Salicola phage SCTP-2]|nr:hypothetical protein PBI_SCTP2_472 [Salicola phage SCTP-2]
MLLYEYDYEVIGNIDKKNLTEEDIGRLYVDSSNVKSFWFEDGTLGMGILTVEFLSGAIYEYYRVPYYVAKMFTKAPSYGRFMWKNIRGIYPYQRVDREIALNKYQKNIGKKPRKTQRSRFQGR